MKSRSWANGSPDKNSARNGSISLKDGPPVTNTIGSGFGDAVCARMIATGNRTARPLSLRRFSGAAGTPQYTVSSGGNSIGQAERSKLDGLWDLATLESMVGRAA